MREGGTDRDRETYRKAEREREFGARLCATLCVHNYVTVALL